jgi:transcriptional regulator with XRE-family HTH domain
MDVVRFGLQIRALRRRRGWTQAQLAVRASLSPSSVCRIERGGTGTFTLDALERITSALGARLVLQAQWHGEELDRLLDASHASLVDILVRRLASAGWDAWPEATFSIAGERGSIDVLAWHPASASLLVTEVKSVMPDVQATVAGLDRKARLAGIVAAQRGWRAKNVSRVLVLPEDRTARRRLARFAPTFERALPARTVEVRRWIREPGPPISGVLFLTDLSRVQGRHRVSRQGNLAVQEHCASFRRSGG